MAHVEGSVSNDSANRRGNQQKCELFNFGVTPEQVRIVLFKECMFKERQLLFDSHSLEVNKYAKSGSPTTENRVGKLFAKNNEEFNHLTEMIFGSTAMKYQETYYKMHNVSSPERVIFTQVFVPRRRKVFRKSSATSFSRSKSNKSSSDLLCLGNADASESSLSGLSDYSSRSDSFSIFRRGSTSTTIDSGFSELSLDSSSSLSHCGSSFAGSSFALSNTSLADVHDSFSSRTNSSENYQIRTNIGYSRLGLALILVEASENDRYRNMFIQHANFIESILWRLRQYIEIALSCPGQFVFMMLDISKNSAQWLLHMTSSLGKWTKENYEITDEQQDAASPISKSIFGSFSSKNVVEFFQSKWSQLSFPRSLFHKKEKDGFEMFCELLRELDTKETNFFLSTLLTAVLTHHTGWISSCYSPREITLDESYNALWRQLTDLQGSTGYLTKTSKTVVYGLRNDDDVIRRVLEFLRYFTRYCRVQRRNVERLDIASENRIVDEICDKAFGKTTEALQQPENKSGLSKTKSGLIKTNSGLIKTKTVEMDLSKLVDSEEELFEDHRRSSVLFILGDDEKLENLKRASGAPLTKPRRNKKRYPRADSLEIVEEMDERVEQPVEMKVINFPLPKVKPCSDYSDIVPFECSLTNDSLQKFVPDMIIQGTNVPDSEWKPILKTDISLSSYPSYNVEESVVVLGDTSKWDVQVWSNNRRRMNKGHLEESVDASRLVSNILEVVLQMQELNLSKQCCTTFIEQRLLGICLKSSALAEFLLTKDFCSVDLLVSTLNLNAVDVPLLMSVVSTLYPEVTKKYGFSY